MAGGGRVCAAGKRYNMSGVHRIGAEWCMGVSITLTNVSMEVAI